MGYARYQMAALSTEDCRCIYVMGGYNGQVLNVTEKYDILKSEWSEVAPMLNGRYMHSAIVMNMHN